MSLDDNKTAGQFFTIIGVLAAVGFGVLWLLSKVLEWLT
jgi:hypothetical protein